MKMKWKVPGMMLLALMAAAVILLGGVKEAQAITNGGHIETVQICRLTKPFKGAKPAAADDLNGGYSGGKYRISKINWFKADNTAMTTEDFEGGETYYAEVTVESVTDPEGDKYYFFKSPINSLNVTIYSGDVFNSPIIQEDESIRAGTHHYHDYPIDSNLLDTLVIRTELFEVKKEHIVSYDTKGHGDNFFESVEPDELAKKPEDPKWAGHIFGGWYDSETGKQFDFATRVRKDYNLYASWLEPITEVTIEGYTEPMLGSVLGTKDDLTVPAGAHYSVETMTWYTGGIAKYGGNFEAGSKYNAQIGLVADPGYAFPAELKSYKSFTVNGKPDIEVYGSDTSRCTFWTMDYYPKCMVKFDKNGGKGEKQPVYVEGGTDYKLPECGFTPPEGKVFDKWDAGAAGATIKVNDHMTLKALWKDKPAETKAPAETKPADEPKPPAETKPAEETKEPAYPEAAATPEKPAKLATVQKAITKKSDEKDLKQSTFSLLKAYGVPKSNKSVKLSWSKAKGATKYLIYGNKCGKKTKYEYITSVGKKTTSYTQKKLKKGTYYKYIIVAVKGKNTLAVSKTIHVATNGGKGKKGNPEAVTLNKKSFSIKVGGSKTVKATVKNGKLASAEHRTVAFETSDQSVVKLKITKNKCKVTGKAKGSCYLYAYAQNGVCAKIKITVK